MLCVNQSSALFRHALGQGSEWAVFLARGERAVLHLVERSDAGAGLPA